jgi:hypothetical protein
MVRDTVATLSSKKCWENSFSPVVQCYYSTDAVLAAKHIIHRCCNTGTALDLVSFNTQQKKVLLITNKRKEFLLCFIFMDSRHWRDNGCLLEPFFYLQLVTTRIYSNNILLRNSHLCNIQCQSHLTRHCQVQ